MERQRAQKKCAQRVPGMLLLLLLLCDSHSTAFELTILHTNDVHARVEQTSRDSGKCIGQDCYGGVARRATMVKRIRASQPHVLLLDAGDQYQGTVWFSYFKGWEVVRFMNLLRYDAMALGNHEFDNGVAGLLDPLLKNVNFPILSANIKASAELANNITGYFLPYKILNFGSERVGIVGYTTKETPVLSNPGQDLLFEDEIAALQSQVDKLTTLGVNKIIALGHSGFPVDQSIAQKVKNVDVVVGGHTNTFLYTGTPPSNNIPAGDYPFMVKSDHGPQVPVVQAYAFGKYLGYLSLTFDKQGNVISASGNPILLNNSIPEDAEVKAQVDMLRVQLNNFSSQEIGKTIVYLNGTSEACRIQECNMGNLICDAVVYNNLRHPDDNQWNHVSMCIINGGGIRAPIDERNNNGTITLEELLAVMPFGGTFDLLQIKGSTLKEAFEHSVHRHGKGTGELLQVAGIHVVYDLSQSPGSRVVSLEVLCTECRVPVYMPLQMEKTYKVILPSFLAGGGDGYYMLKGSSNNHSSGDLDVAVVSNYIYRMGKVFPAVEGRVKFSTGTIVQGQHNFVFGLFVILLCFVL
ncbi:5'-nucleotidase [Eublepharis macularius]|uniref:Snake venom 5'-nucleotidase n=1 Tax=Eublepharis macularius TaxID=481883 RepID=A0AA97LHN1_EUBMA|nr:5'-nucleotidase [Eublepharis macularius]